MPHAVDRKLWAEVVKIHVPISRIGSNEEVESLVLETQSGAYVIAFEESAEEIELFARPATPEQLEFLHSSPTRIEIKTFTGLVKSFQRSSVVYLTEDEHRDEQKVIINLVDGKTISLRHDESNLYPYSFRFDSSIGEDVMADMAAH